MRKVFFLVHIVCFQFAAAQDFPGIRSSNYFGINSAFTNPANLADSRHVFDFNLLSVHTSIGNDQLSYRLKTIGETLSGDNLTDQFLKGESGRTNALVGLSLHGPSFMISPGKRLGIGVTSRARLFGTITNFEGRLFGSTDDEDAEVDPDLPYNFQKGQDMKVAAHLFSEIGLSAAYVIMNRDAHFLKGGTSLKYLIGVGNAYYNLQNLSGTIDEQPDDLGPYLTNTQGRIAVGMAGLNLDAADFDDVISKESRGFGGDIGFVYEYRPDYTSYRDASGNEMGDKNKYKFKIGVSLLDIGRIKYEKDPNESAYYNVNIGPGQRVYLDEIGNRDDDETINDYFASRPDVFQPVPGNTDAVYRVNLPTTLNIDVDYQLHNRVYLNVYTQIPVSGKSSDPYNNKLYTTVALTPRFETKAFGFYLPVQYNALTKLNVGTSFRFGPLFVGSGSVLTALIGNAKQADIHVGLRFGSLRKNKAVKQVDPATE